MCLQDLRVINNGTNKCIYQCVGLSSNLCAVCVETESWLIRNSVLTGLCCRPSTVQVLVAMAQKVAEIMAEGAEGVNALSIEEQAQGSAERAPNIEASAVSAGDDLLFFVSTDADTTMFGR